MYIPPATKREFCRDKIVSKTDKDFSALSRNVSAFSSNPKSAPNWIKISEFNRQFKNYTNS